MISDEEFEHLASLSKLNFSEEEKDKFKQDFSSIIEFASKISQTNTSGEGYIASIDLCDLRADTAKAGLTQQEVVSNAPQQQDGAFVVPKIMD